MAQKQTLHLSNGTLLEAEEHMLPSAIFGVRWQGNTKLLIFANRLALTLHLHVPHQEFESARLSGAALETHAFLDVPLSLYLLLAFIALKHALPEKSHAVLISEVAVFITPSPVSSTGMLTDEELRARAARVFETRESEFFPGPGGIWNLARFLLLCGESAWRLRNGDARFWASFPAGPLLEQQEEVKTQRALLAKLAALAATHKELTTLPFPVAPTAQLEFAWWDWMALAAGPAKPSAALRPGGGLGEIRGSLLETNLDPYHMALSVEHTTALETLAHTLLQKVERPYPRYLGRVLNIQLPLHLLPLLRRWGIDRLLVQVEATGVYLSVLDRAGGCIGAAWWEASRVSASRVPCIFPAAAWTLLHAMLSAFWKDLCSNSILVGPKPPSLTTGIAETKHGGKKRKKRSQAVKHLYLPPVRSVPAEQASWTDRQDEERIHRTTQTAHWYRLLPKGWEQREGKPDYQRRRALAIERARAAGQPEPLPGFTFVHRLSEEERLARNTGEPLPRVHARGLLALSLVLQEQAIEIASNEEE